MRLGKVLVVGAAEAGKSTLIRALCPEAVNLEVNGRTVAMDHATLSRDGQVLSLVGVPGQPRFEPVREALAVGTRCTVWVHRAGTPSDPLTTSLVARLVDRQVPYFVYVNQHRSSTATGWPAPAGLPPPEAVLEGDLLDPDGSVGHLVEVDLYIPGCPPHAAFIFEGLLSVLRGRPPKIERRNVCFNCTRTMVKTDVTTLRRAHEGTFDTDLCFLSQGCLCFGSVTLDRCMAPCMQAGVPCFSCCGPSEAVILEPQKDVRSEVAYRMAHLTKIPSQDIVAEIERQAKTHFAYAMASPVFRQKPTFLLKKWTRPSAEKGA